MDPTDPIIDLDTGEPIQLGTDIGVDTSTRSGPRRPTNGTTSRPPWKIVAVIAGIVAAASLIFSVFGGSDRAIDRALPQPTPVPTPTPFDDQGARDPSRPANDVIPIVAEDITRAGEGCLARPADPGAAFAVAVRFTVPNGLSAHGCEAFGTDPANARLRDQLILQVWLTDADLNQAFELWTRDRLPDATQWHPIDGRRGWRLDFDQLAWVDERSRWARSVVVVEVPEGTLVVTAVQDPDSPLHRTELLAAFDQLVESIEIDVPEPDPFHVFQEPGGWCSGEDFVTQVPVGWFANPNCRWLNTSSESPIVLRCDCLPPLAVQRLTIPFDGDFGFTTIDSDRIEARPDGTSVRVIEGLRPDANNQERPLLAKIVDSGDARIAVVASRFTEHALPGHTYEDTLDAQEFLLDHLRFHSGSDCGAGQRWLADSTNGHIALRLTDDETVDVPSGAALLGTGCTQRESGELEVRLEASPHLVGWVDAAQVRSPEPTLCPTGEGVFRPAVWDELIRGDFDGDGREDVAYTRSFEDALAFGDLPSAAVLYANGGLAEGSFGARGAVDTSLGWPSSASVRRLPGVGHDLLELEWSLGRADSYEIRDLSNCSFELAAWASLENSADARSGVCEVRTELGAALRIWAGSIDPHQGLVLEVDELWTGRNGRLLFARAPWTDDPPCGPALAERRMWAPPGTPGAALAGRHPLTLQWASSRDGSIGEIEFRALGEDTYKVDGRHVAAPGVQLSMTGVIEVLDENELVFEGTITTLVAQINGGDQCVRNAGQRFVRRPGTDVFRLKDRINCDGARTDWIDITLPATLEVG